MPTLVPQSVLQLHLSKVFSIKVYDYLGGRGGCKGCNLGEGVGGIPGCSPPVKLIIKCYRLVCIYSGCHSIEDILITVHTKGVIMSGIPLGGGGGPSLTKQPQCTYFLIAVSCTCLVAEAQMMSYRSPSLPHRRSLQDCCISKNKQS